MGEDLAMLDAITDALYVFSAGDMISNVVVFDGKVKRCHKCGEVKSVGEFSKDSKTADGLRCRCKACNAKYYEANREKLLEYRKEYYEANREKKLEYQKEYYDANREKLLEQQKEYYEANREKLLEYQKKYYTSREGKTCAAFKVAKRKCSRLGRPFNITRAEWLNIASMPCVYCVMKRVDLRSDRERKSGVVGLDRIDNVGYSIFECLPCCWSHNNSKRDMSSEQYALHLDRAPQELQRMDNQWEERNVANA